MDIFSRRRNVNFSNFWGKVFFNFVSVVEIDGMSRLLVKSVNAMDTFGFKKTYHKF